MGAHFAPPFAIITMQRIEREALKSLEEKYNFVPTLYKRYIDDILIGPITRSAFVNKIGEVFNSINKNIQFTLEIPEKEHFLSFLDIDLRIQNGVEYKWHIKPGHSNNSLHFQSWVPMHVKSNYLANYMKNVSEKCSSKTFCNEALVKLKQRFFQNGFNGRHIKRASKNKTKVKSNNGNCTFLSLDFVSDALNRRINNLIKKYNLPVRLISKPPRSLKQMFKSKRPKKTKHDNCTICDHLPRNLNCTDRFLVYKFTCKHCFSFYIGETSRPFLNRYREHERSLKNENQTSALSEHACRFHQSLQLTIQSFDLEILRHCKNAVEARMAEAQAIRVLGPPLNRRYERE